MSRASNEVRRGRIRELQEQIDKEIEYLEARIDEYSKQAFEYKQEAQRYASADLRDKALHYIKLWKSYENLATSTMNRIGNLTTISSRLDTTSHKLLLRLFPEELTSQLENIDPSVNPNNNSLERRLSRKYGLANYNSPEPVAEENTNVVESRGCLRDAFGRCIERIKSRLTRKNGNNKKNKKEGGRRKAKSMKRRK